MEGANGMVLITGASGLLGRTLVAAAERAGLQVLAQCHRQCPPGTERVSWIQADFSTSGGIAEFLHQNAVPLAACTHFIHAYGPITCVDTAEMTGADLQRDFHGNVLTADEIFRFLRAKSRLRSAVFIGFADAGRLQAYRKVLAYAAAKNALLLLVRSWAAAFPQLRVNMVSPATIAGADVPGPNGSPVEAERVARVVLQTLLGKKTGQHRRVLR
jgi:NAD(P)-dependent dehydrogenase (short-subunit alcohol dehydrogenase family)